MDSQADTHEVTEGGSPKDECISSVSADNEKPFVLETPCQLSKQRSLQDPDQLSTTQNSKETGCNIYIYIYTYIYIYANLLSEQ